ncbi:DUF2726 domain-containing protein [Pseudoruminococcus massiliensis]|uniref:DUF2726 domain-containing protein n=1 Tax=Pseudoruminococcus massiliensis TaxID=2086583 RepID=UPI000D0FF20D|nr:DUF2726 domain-containing protein [Pseudoruminococcus massiliensis]
MICEFCGDNSGKYNLCKKCYYLFKDGKLIKCEKCGKWHSPNSSCESSSIQSNDAQQSQKFIYNPKPSLITEAEKGFYNVIKELIPDNYLLFPQINLAAVISKDDDSSHFQNELFRNIDFLITDSEFKPLIFIEINDSSHNSNQRKERDQKVHNICEEAGIPIITLWTSYGVNKEYIKKRIDTTLSELPIKRIAHSKPTENSQKTQKNSGGCYVATCVYGSYDCPQVWTLRRFRDFKLSKSFLGRLFIKTYYKISPKIVKLFGKQKWFKVFWKKRLDKMVFRLQKDGYENTPYYDR